MLSEDDKERIVAEVHDFRRAAAVSTPVDIDRCLTHAELGPPMSLFARLDAYLQYHRSDLPEEFSWWQDGLWGAVDPYTNEIYVDTRLPHRRLTFVLAHELMHVILGHCEVMKRGGSGAKRMREHMEAEATFAAVELQCPTQEFRAWLLETTPVWRRPRLVDIRRAGDHFDVSIYTALRRTIDTETAPRALVTLHLPRRYRGGNQPRFVTARSVANAAWLAARGTKPIGEGVSLDTFENGLAFRASLVLSGQRGRRYLADVCEHARWHFAAGVEAALTANSLHLLLTP